MCEIACQCSGTQSDRCVAASSDKLTILLFVPSLEIKTCDSPIIDFGLTSTKTLMMAKDEGDDLLPDKDAAKGFYAKYEPKEILGRLV